MLRRALITAVVVLLAACAPAYTTIYDANSTIVSGGAGAHAIKETWTVGSTTHTTRNYLASQWTVDCATKDNYALDVTGGSTTPDIGAFGGEVRATQAPLTLPWEATGSSGLYGYHYCPGIKAETDGVIFDRWHISGMGDGMVFRANGATNGTNSRFSRSWVYKSGDDCVQNDSLGDGNAVEENLLDQCWAGISSRQSSGDASGASMDIANNIVYVADHPIPACYHYLPADGGKACPSHAGWLKWADPSVAMKATIRGNVFVASTYPMNSGDLKENAPIAADPIPSTPANENCDGNTLLFLSTDAAQQALFNADAASWAAAGCTNTTIQVGFPALVTASNAINNWHAAHDALLQDPSNP